MRMMMMKGLFNPTRRFLANPSSLLRHLCTPVTVEHTESPPTTTTPATNKKVVTVEHTEPREDIRMALNRLSTPREDSRRALNRLSTPREDIRMALNRLSTPREDIRRALNRLSTPREDSRRALNRLSTLVTMRMTEEDTVKKVVKVRRDLIYRKLTVPGSSKASTFETLNGLFPPEIDFCKTELFFCILQLGRNGQVPQALQVMEWMQTRNIELNHAIKLYLISKDKGTSAAENYFNGLPESAKDKSTYGALLNCYCRGKLTDKALDLFGKMDKMQFLSSISFNNLMSLYMRLHLPEKVPPLVQEMKNRNIPLSMLTYNIWISSYACLKDIEAAEGVIEEKRHNSGGVLYHWRTLSNLAVAYVKTGLYEKAESTLKTLEERIGEMGKHCGPEPFHYLISLYAGTSNLVKVHEVWKHLKSTFKITTNKSTLAMLEALARLDDVNGFKRIFKEWESTCSTYDKRLPYRAIGFYQKHGMLNEAEEVFHNVLKSNKGNTRWYLWKRMMPYYLEKRQLDFALKCLETAISVIENNELHPTPEDADRFMEYFKKERDVNNAEKFCKILKKVNLLDSNAYKLLLETYVAANKEAPDMRNRIMDDEIKVSPELEELLRRIAE